MTQELRETMLSKVGNGIVFVSQSFIDQISNFRGLQSRPYLISLTWKGTFSCRLTLSLPNPLTKVQSVG